MADEELPDRAGEMIDGRYRLGKRLGAGGMGEVYRAVNEKVGREVAIKILKPEYAKSADVVARVEREARAANAVQHPNIVDVIDVLNDRHGSPVIVQELLVGEDLAAFVRLRGGALSERDALDLMIPVAEALGAAHSKGIMHRDLKLENVFLDRRTGAAVPKVLDFGLSRGIGEAAVSRLTATGVAMGTPMYMSPEQVQGQRDVDQRTDVWALGIMLYELVTGRLPFEGESLGAIFVKVCTADPPSLRSVAPGVSVGFEGVVSRCLQRERGQRFENAALLAEALRAVRANATDFVSAVALQPIDSRGQTLAASANSMNPALISGASSAPPSAPPPSAVAVTLQPVGNRGALAQSIGPTVSTVPPAPRRSLKVVSIAALLTLAVVGAGLWLHASGENPPRVIATPRPAARPPAIVAPPPIAPAAPAAPTVAVGTPAYDNHPPFPPGTGTPAYDPTPAPTPPARPATTVYDPATAASNEPTPAGRHGRHGRRVDEHPHPAPHGHGHAPLPGGGTPDYE